MSNRFFMPLALLSALFCSFMSAPLWAQDVYISDELFVPLRSGMGTQYRIIHRGLPSGTRLKLIEEKAEEGWSLVETSRGDKGWIRNQYINRQPTAKIKLKRAEQQLQALTQERNQLRDQRTELQQQNDNLTQQLASANSSTDSLSQELAHIKQISAGSIDLHNQYQALSKEHQLLQTQVDVLKAENERLQSDQVYREWLFGVGILILGVILTLILQSTSKRKRYSEWA